MNEAFIIAAVEKCLPLLQEEKAPLNCNESLYVVINVPFDIATSTGPEVLLFGSQ